MKKLSVAIAAMASLAAPAFAGGLTPPVVESEPVAAVPAPAPVQSWEGFYAGVTGGSATSGGATYKTPGSADTGFDMGRGSYGVFGGYNLQRGALVYGGEIAAQATDFNLDGAPGKFDNMIDLKARAGMAYGKALPYAFVGYSRGDWKNGDGQSNGAADGVNYGLGVDYAVNDKWTVGAELMRRELSTDFDGSDGSVDTNFNTVQVRAGFRF
ncbi:outer membrane protein [Rhodobacter capsulatus]|uniref:outer membrane protein n=1 Tax=Rhodobacter capsulatus TaxID=1061 RepID=UPI004025D18C